MDMIGNYTIPGETGKGGGDGTSASRPRATAFRGAMEKG